MALPLPLLFPYLELLWLVAAVAAVVVLVVSLAASVRQSGPVAARRLQASAVDAFAEAVAVGDLSRAEAEARRAFGESQEDAEVRHPPRPRWSQR